MLPCFSKRRKVSPSMLVGDSVVTLLNTPPLQQTMTSAVEKKSGATVPATDYQLYQAIGVGCFGAATIYISQHTPSKTFTVARLIDLDVLTACQLEDVQDEMKISNALHHINILKYVGSFVIGSKLWAIQPLMHYGSCADIMHSAQPFRNGFRETVISAILRDIVNGLDYLHSLGFVHRSIRAKHFLIQEDGVVKLSGLRSVASLIEQGARAKAIHGHFGGTVDNICWLAPEVLAQDLHGYSFQSDMYSVGIAALELATGEAPFAGLPVTEIMMLKLRGHPPILMKSDGGNENQLSTQLTKVIDLCVDPDPSKRPSPVRLLGTSFFKMRKKSLALKDLLLPVVPLDISKLTLASATETGLEDDIQYMRTEGLWV